ncbi:hypothetical protein K0M31_001726 [Melipona bicolor]|uniref:Uncharacterized protein n=1 Tax=Melipona bicolor TaxID=60889 RepID=A0AA40GG39_9HYME|nr:hypothetical protein K0M31_001726 [Melipona bicolor]
MKENPTEIGEVVTDEEKQRVGDGRPGSRCVERSSYFRGRDGYNSDQHCRGYCIVAFTTETTEITEIAKGRQKESRVVRNLWDRTKKQRGMSEGKEAPRTSVPLVLLFLHLTGSQPFYGFFFGNLDASFNHGTIIHSFKHGSNTKI